MTLLSGETNQAWSGNCTSGLFILITVYTNYSCMVFVEAHFLTACVLNKDELVL